MNIKTLFRQFENPDSFSIENILVEFIIPEGSANFVANPEVLTLSGYGGTSTISLDDTRQAYGINSLASTINYLQTITTDVLINFDGNTSYTFSVDIIGSGDFELYFTSGGIQIGGFTKITSTDNWHRYSHTAHFRDGVNRTNIAATIRSVAENTTANINLDGFQVEAKPYPTTFISGTRRGNFTGLKEYYWNGNAHDSASTRLSSTTTGGKVIALSELGIDLLGLNGLGMLEIANTSQDLAMKQVSLYTGSNFENRQFELLLNINSTDHKDYLQKRNKLVQLVNPNKTPKQQPVRILFTLVDCGRKVSETVYIDSVYVGGLAGEFSNFYNERFALSLIAYDPMLKSLTENTCELDKSFSGTIERGESVITNSNVDANWEEINSFALYPQAFTHTSAVIGPDGKYWVLGLMAKNSKKYLGVRWNGSSWETIGEFNKTGGLIQGFDVAFINNTAYFAGTVKGTTGSVTDSGNGVNILGYDIQSDSFFKIGEIDGPTRAIATDGRYLYVGGQFNSVTDNLSVTITSHSIARYDTITDTWLSMPSDGFLPAVANGGSFDSGLDYIATIAIDKSGIVWFGGNFTINAALENVTRYDPYKNVYLATESLVVSTYPTSPLSAAASIVEDIIVTDGGDVYAGGTFDATYTTNQNPTILNRLDRPISVAKWSGSTWLPLQALLAESTTPEYSDSPAIVYQLEYDNIAGLLYAVGKIDYAGLQYISPYVDYVDPYTTYLHPNNGGGAFVYNGSTWSAVPLNFGTGSNIAVAHFTLGSYFEFGAFTTSLTGQLDGYGLPAELQSAYFIGINSIAGTQFEVPALTSCPNECGDLANPIVTIVGPGTFSSIRNIINGSIISFTDLRVLDGQVVTIDLTGLIPNIVPNIAKSKLNKSSNLTTFRLSPGNNVFEVFYKDTTEDSRVYVTYRKQHLSIDAIGGEC